jgi:GT2 family glycosyltransferase
VSKKISIVIVNWNSGSQLQNCINSIQRFGVSYVSKIIIVDNGSTDGSINNIVPNSSVSLILAGSNLGFAKACNLGAELAVGNYLLFLNPDAALHKHTLAVAMEFMERRENANVGICGVQLVDDFSSPVTSSARFPTLRILAGSALGLRKILPEYFPAHFMSPEELMESKVVEQVIGAFFFVRKTVFEICGGFDERFFVYFEEVDLSLRAKKLGYLSFFLKEATAFHKGGGCSESVKAARLFYSLRSRVLYAQKHYSAVSYVLLIILTLVEFPLRVLRGILRRSLVDVKDTVIAYGQFLRYFLRRV